MNFKWIYDDSKIDFTELSELYKIAPLGIKSPEHLKKVFSNSMFKCFVFDGDILIGVGRALADGEDCSYLCDIAIHPQYQGLGIGKDIVDYLVRSSEGHKKIILYASPGKEGFYKKLGFSMMKTAMGIFQNQEDARKRGITE